ncbi:hypothetical protein CFP56_019540 [Quercus suber]|uniref:Uncharacterized protein n=1 Tax=Quercus suber TaxID=58331 RepID=A0AAW0KI52_QUESU
MVELGNDTNERGIVVDSMVASDNNDDVGLERCEGHLNVASQDPLKCINHQSSSLLPKSNQNP